MHPTRPEASGSAAPVSIARHAPAACAPATRPTIHSHAAMLFVTGGSSRIEQRGAWRLAPGDVFLVPAGEPHRMVEASQASYWGLSFCAPCFAAAGAAELLEPFERVRDGASAIVRLPAERWPFVETLLCELEASGAIDPAHPVQRSLLTLLLHEVDRAASPLQQERTPARSVVAESLRFIERNCLQPITLQDVAAAVGRSPAYVTSALTRATGRSAGAWILSGRMAEARRRLLHSDEPVERIAEQVGYADPTHFIRMFRRTEGAPPAAWRAARRAGREPVKRSQALASRRRASAGEGASRTMGER